MLAVDIIALVLQSVKRKQVCKLAFHITISTFNDLCSSSSIDFQTFLQTQLLVMGHFDSNSTRIDPFWVGLLSQPSLKYFCVSK